VNGFFFAFSRSSAASFSAAARFSATSFMYSSFLAEALKARTLITRLVSTCSVFGAISKRTFRHDAGNWT
jgi:hypothetical protein